MRSHSRLVIQKAVFKHGSLRCRNTYPDFSTSVESILSVWCLIQHLELDICGERTCSGIAQVFPVLTSCKVIRHLYTSCQFLTTSNADGNIFSAHRDETLTGSLDTILEYQV